MLANPDRRAAGEAAALDVLEADHDELGAALGWQIRNGEL